MDKEHHMTMVIDSCHSGTIDREISYTRTEIDNRSKPKTIPTPLDLMSRVESASLYEETFGLSLEEGFDVEIDNLWPT